VRDKIIFFLEFIVSLVFLMFFQDYFVNVLNNFGINLNQFSDLMFLLIMFGIQIILCIILYFIYKGNIKQHGHSFKNHFLKNLLYSLLILAVMTVVMSIANYFIKYVANMFKVSVDNNINFNVLQKNISINYLINLLRYAFLVPFSYTIVYILGVERLFRKSGIKIIMSGLIWAVITSINYIPSLINMFFNSLSTFILGMFLAYIYSRNKNIWYPIVIYGLYLLFAPLLIGYLGW